jgi:DNA polymerase III subunit chi
MTERVDFYILNGNAPRQRWNFACRLTEKAYLRDLKVVILSDSVADAQAFDDLLWTFNERSFVPHKLCLDPQAIDPATPVHVTLDAAALSGADLLLNLTQRVPPKSGDFIRIAEIIDADPEHRRLGRERFKAYRDLKLTPQTHQLDETGVQEPP